MRAATTQENSGLNLAGSIYLDAVRFGASAAVFLAHASAKRLTGGLFWQVQPFGHLAVTVFFVLSGLVIAYAADQKDRTLYSYTLNRLSRLYSVVVPAIALTLAADALGTRLAPQLYTPDWGYADSIPLIRVVTSLTFTSDIRGGAGF